MLDSVQDSVQVALTARRPPCSATRAFLGLLTAAVVTAGCSRESTSDSIPTASVGNPSGEVQPVAVSASTANTVLAVTAASGLGLEAPRELPGTGIRVALPKGTVRVGRELTFKFSVRDEQAMTLTLAHQSSTSPASAALERAVKIFSTRGEFNPTDAPYELPNAPGHHAAFGVMTKDLLGNPTVDLPGIIGTYGKGDHLLFALASFPGQFRATADGIVASLDVDAEAKLDPLTVAGVQLDVSRGYVIKPNQLHPIVVLPDGASLQPGQPSLDIRLAGPDRTAGLLQDMLATFGADMKNPGCGKPEADKPSSGGSAKASASPRQTCSFQSKNGTHRVRMMAVEDEHGGLVAITTLPNTGADAHDKAFAAMVESLALTKPPSLL